MSKLKNPLVSLAAVGRLGQALVFSRRRHTDLVSLKGMPLDRGTAAQSGQRQRFLDCIADWHALTPSEQRQQQSLASRYNLTGYQYYMRTCLLLPPVPPPPPQLYENYDDPNANGFVNQFIWWAQTFTPQASHNSTSAKFKLQNASGLPTQFFTLALQGVDGAGKPDGVDLTSLTVPPTDFAVIPDVWYEFVFPANPLLTAFTQYAFVLRTTTVGFPGVFLRLRGNTGAYPRGQAWFSPDQATSWILPVTDPEDASFEDWGTPA